MGLTQSDLRNWPGLLDDKGRASVARDLATGFYRWSGKRPHGGRLGIWITTFHPHSEGFETYGPIYKPKKPLISRRADPAPDMKPTQWQPQKVECGTGSLAINADPSIRCWN